MTDLQKELEQLKIRIDQNGVELDAVDENRTKLFEERAAIEAKIAGEAKPKLRHLDYGQDKDGQVRIVVRVLPAEGEAFTSAGSYCLTSDMIEPHVILGNLADDIKALQEPATAFEITDARGDKLIVTTNHSGELHFEIKSAGNFAGDCLAFGDKAKRELILKLHQMEATLKRQQGV